MVLKSHHIVKEDTAFKEVLKRLDILMPKTIFVIDQSGRLVGSITDGDIRRGLLFGNEQTKAVDFCNTNLTYKYQNGAYVNFKKNELRLIPIVNDERQIIDFIKALSKVSLVDTMVIMAGGEGKRLGRVTRTHPKPMVQVRGKPMLEHILTSARERGVSNFYLCVNYLKSQIIDHFENGHNLGIKIHYIEEENKLDTAGALSLIKANLLPKTFFVKNCDVFEHVNYRDLVNSHISQKNSVTILAVPHSTIVPFGVLNHERMKLTSIDEKPIIEHLVSGGLYVFDRQCLSHLKYNEPLSMPDFITRVRKNNAVVSLYKDDGYWLDAGTPDELGAIEL